MSISSLFGLYARNNPGERDFLLGVEFELEDVSDSHDEQPEGYERHGDGSLRNGVEYVFEEPLPRQATVDAITEMEEFLSTREYSTSERTSTHIHLNMLDSNSSRRLASTMFALVYMIEPAIFRAADENRKWCGYCQPLSDMPQQRVIDLLSDDDSRFRTGALGEGHADKYFGLNMKSLSRHGTIEFRYFPGWQGKAAALRWIDLVVELRIAAETIGSVSNALSAGSSADSLRTLLREAMPSAYSMIADGVEDSEIERRAEYLQALIANRQLPVAIGVSRLASVEAGSSMEQFMARAFGASVSADGRKAMLLAELVRNGSLTTDLVQDLDSVLRNTTDAAFYELFRDTLNNTR